MQNGMHNGMMMNGMMDPRQSTAGGMAIDQETTVNGIPAACTGVGDQQENSARWSAYPVKVVVSGTGHQFFSGETVSITKSDGSQVAQMTCNAPWVLMKLEPGAYHATVSLPGHGAKNHKHIGNLYTTLLNAAGDRRETFGQPDPLLGKDVDQRGPVGELLA